MERKIDQLEKQQNDIADAAKRVLSNIIHFLYNKTFSF
jgi:hypothetical protein